MYSTKSQSTHYNIISNRILPNRILPNLILPNRIPPMLKKCYLLMHAGLTHVVGVSPTGTGGGGGEQLIGVDWGGTGGDGRRTPVPQVGGVWL